MSLSTARECVFVCVWADKTHESRRTGACAISNKAKLIFVIKCGIKLCRAQNCIFAYFLVRFNVLCVVLLKENGCDWSSICCLLLSISAWLPQLKDNGWGIYYYLLVKWSGVGDKVMKLMSGQKRGDPSTSKRSEGQAALVELDRIH